LKNESHTRATSLQQVKVWSLGWGEGGGGLGGDSDTRRVERSEP